MMWRNALGSALLVAAVAVTWWFGRVPANGPSLGPAESATGYYLKGANITQIGAEGQTLYELAAEEIVQNPDDDSILLETVRLDYSLPEGGWSLEAARGRIPSSQDEIQLSGDVLATGTQTENADTAIIRTDSLNLDVKAQTASTTDPVLVEIGAYQVKSVGLQADLKENRLRLQSEVHGRFSPP